MRPVDYDAANAAVDAEHWLRQWRPDAHVEALASHEVSWLRRARTLAQLSGAKRLSALFDDEMRAFEAAHAGFGALLASTPLFVRAGNVSFKYGVHGGSAPLRSLRHIVESMLTSDEGHQPLSDIALGVPRSNVTLYAVPWEPRICEATEWRVFVCQGRVTAITQQVWFKPLGHTPATAEAAARAIVPFMHDRVLPALRASLPASHVADVAAFADGSCHFIEVNPFGRDRSSGSGLFHWLRDSDVLHGTSAESAPGNVTVAIVVP